MAHRESAVFAITPKSVAGLAIFFLVLAAFFGFLNSQKVKTLRANVANAQAARDAAERRRVQEKPTAPTGGTATAEERGKVAEAETRAAKAETELAQMQTEKADLQAKLDSNQQEIASLQKRVEEAEKTTTPAGSPVATALTGDSQSQLDDLRRQLDSAEKEKALLADKLQDAQERAGPSKEGKKRREPGTHRTGLNGTILAANQAYNFVVLNLGARQGVESNSEMLILRDGTLIGKIRISSVEPATAIGDIITNSLARGVQVQPGDTVIYAGTNP
jgi:cell shape-determining protein MreC